MVDWRKSNDGYHAYIGPFFAQITRTKKSWRAKVQWPLSIRQASPTLIDGPVSTPLAGMQTCNLAVRDHMLKIRTDLAKNCEEDVLREIINAK